MSSDCSSMPSFSSTCRIALLAVFVAALSATQARADVCVWRDPERTMAKVFPKAKDYKTIDVKITPEQRARIERRLGRLLDPGERETWTSYEIVGHRGGTLGYIIADAEKGEFGVIEIVMGIDPGATVVQIYIQRARERNKEFKTEEFLAQFAGKSKTDSLSVGKDIKATASIPTDQTAFGVRKMLIMFDELKTNQETLEEAK